MKRYVPYKYILGMIALYLVMPVTIVLLIYYLWELNDFSVPVIMFCATLILAGPFVFIKNLENASIIIGNNMLTNYVNDGTSNFGWAEEISRIRSVVLVGKNEVQQYYANCKSKRSLLIDFGSGNIKYISVTLFSKGQVQKIMKSLRGE